MGDFDNITRSELEEMIEQRIIGRHAERNRKVLKRRLIDGIIFDRLAEEFDLSVTQVKNIVYKGAKRLCK